MTPRGSSAPRTPIVHLEVVDSTNAEAQRRAASGERGPLWITAARQTAGRGRSGRSWTSAGGSLAATLLVTTGAPATAIPQLSLLAGVAAHDALARVISDHRGRAEPALRLKWPNDLLLGGVKLGGILVECGTFDAALVAFVGIGINVAARADVAGRPTAALADLGIAPTPSEVLLALDDALLSWLAVWSAGAGFADLRRAWLDRAGPAGEPMLVNAGEGAVAGAFAGLDQDGALLLDAASGERRRFAWGDVTLARDES